MKKPTFLFVLIFSYMSGAQNLVLNPSFEDFNECPSNYSHFHLNVKNWSIPNNGTTDYFNSCSEKMGFKNFVGNQKARTGNGYAGVYTYFKKDYREYLQGKLKSTLKRGKKYQVKFYISLAENSRYALKELGIMMQSRMFNNSKSKVNIYARAISKRHPTIKFRPTFSKTFHDNEKEWTEISFTYTAEGFENYFVIGNFNTNSLTKKSKARKSKYESFSYYYIDDVSIVPLEKEEVKELEKTPQKPTLKVNEVYTFKSVLFDFDKAKLLESSLQELNKLSKHLKTNPNLNVEIYGHTDNVGLDVRNQELSEQRAKAVADYLISLGLDDSKVKFRGFGSSKPVTTNKTEEGRQQNRRVEFKLKDIK